MMNEDVLGEIHNLILGSNLWVSEDLCFISEKSILCKGLDLYIKGHISK